MKTKGSKSNVSEHYLKLMCLLIRQINFGLFENFKSVIFLKVLFVHFMAISCYILLTKHNIISLINFLCTDVQTIDPFTSDLQGFCPSVYGIYGFIQ